MGRRGLIEWVFSAGGIAALSTVVAFFAVLSWNHGSRALHRW